MKDAVLFLDVIDFALSKRSATYSDDASLARELDWLLSQARMAYTVGTDEENNFRLEKRFDSTVATAADQVMSSTNRASVHLRRAWTAVYGLEPNPSHGYHEAVKAVEAASRPIVLPKNDEATLGQVIRALTDAPQKWRLVFTSTKVNGVAVVADMMRLLWKSQFDRHGTDDESIPLEVSPEEAEAALHLATTLVHWLTQGALVVAKA